MPALNCIRSLAILFVIVAHLGFFAWGSYSTEPLLSALLNSYAGKTELNPDGVSLLSLSMQFLRGDLLDYGILGVSLFFLLSGYLFAKQNKTIPAYAIFIRRIIRIQIPLFFIYFSVYQLIILGYFGNTNFDVFHQPFLLSHLLLIGQRIPTSGLLWSIEMELFFYILYLIFLPRHYARLVISFIILIAFSVLNPLFGWIPFIDNHYLFWVLYIFSGCAVLFHKSHFAMVAALAFGMFTGALSSIQLLSACVAYFLFMVIFAIETFPKGIEKISQFIARISYSCYLVHLMVLSVTTYHLQARYGLNMDIAISIGLFMVFLVSFLSSMTLERFSIDFGRGLSKRVQLRVEKILERQNLRMKAFRSLITKTSI